MGTAIRRRCWAGDERREFYVWTCAQHGLGCGRTPEVYFFGPLRQFLRTSKGTEHSDRRLMRFPHPIVIGSGEGAI